MHGKPEPYLFQSPATNLGSRDYAITNLHEFGKGINVRGTFVSANIEEFLNTSVLPVRYHDVSVEEKFKIVRKLLRWCM